MWRTFGLAIALALGPAASPVSTRSTSAPVGGYLLQTRGLWAEFEDPSSRFGWYDGQLLNAFADSSIQRVVSQQFVHMRAMGANEIAFEIRSGDGDQGTPFPDCKLSTWLGPLWPRPTPTQLAGLGTLLDLAQKQGMRVTLILDSTHLEEQPPTNAQNWLGAILGAVKSKPALDLIAFGGDRHLVDAQPPFDGVPDSCGGQAEPPLWLGPDSLEARYVQWAIGYGLSLGLPPQKLTAEAIVGDYRHEAEQPAGPTAEDGHLWRPLEVMRTIFDRLGVSDAQRTYALSYYAHTKCSFVTFGSCSDEDQFAWAAQTLRVSRSRVGSAARMTLIEWGTNRTDHAIPHTVEHLGVLMQQLGIEGGNYYKWSDAPANDPQWAYNPQALVKVRGPGYIYQPVQRELADLYGFHLTAIANGSFEDGTNGWTVAGQGKAQPTALDETAVPWRGKTFLRLTATDSASITGAPIQVSPSTAYTTTANLRFAWTGEPKVKPKPKSKSKAKAKPKPVQRPQVDVIFRYLTCAHRPSAVRRQDISAYFRQNSTNGFQTFPFKHTTPKDTCFVQIQFVAARNHLPTPITLDIDNIR